MQLLIVEDQPADLRIAAAVARDCGYPIVEARSSSAAAQQFLEKALEGVHPLPDAILLDLDLGHDSGFELLRFWHANPETARVPVIVWTILGERYREICEMFKVSGYVDKGAGAAGLRKALGKLGQLAS